MQSRGFTLTELVVVIVLIGILGVVIFPRFANKTDFDRAGYKDQLTSAMKFGRKIAVASRRYVCVTISGNRLSLALDPLSPDNLTSINCTVNLNLPGSSSSSTAAPDNVTLANGGTVSFRFDPSGQAVSSPGVTTNPSISVASSSGTQTINVESSGYVH